MKDKILEIVHTKPKHYTLLIKSQTDLLSWVMSNTCISEEYNLKDHIRSALYSETNKCECGRTKRLKSISYGFICVPKCPLVRESVRESVKKTKSKVTKEEQELINERRKQTNNTKYGEDYYFNREKAKETNQKRYGVDHYSQTDEFKEKTKETNQKRYGTDYYSQTDEFKEKTTKTKLYKYGDANFNNRAKANKTSQEKYGVDHYSQTDEFKEKTKKTHQECYGVDYYSQTDEFKEKAKETNQKRYGVDHYSQTDEFKERFKQTKLNKYGDANFVNPEKAKQTKQEKYNNPNFVNPEKAKQTSIERYGVDNPSQQHVSEKSMAVLLNPDSLFNLVSEYGAQHTSYLLGVNRTTVDNYLIKYDLYEEFKKQPSGPELKLKSWLNLNDVNFESNNRTILNGLELDFYFPEYNLAIEINGIYWHSSAPTNNRDKNYHYRKWLACRSVGITLLQYTDSEIYDKFDIITNKIKYMTDQHKIVIGARKCIISPVSNLKDVYNLLEHNHMQGKVNVGKNSLGAYYDNKLVAMISWSKRKNYLEITRYCCDTKASYPGLFNKMIKAMIKELNYTGEIVSFSNNDHSNGNVYDKSGFKQDKILGPAYWYTRDFKTLENRQRYMKSKIQKKFKLREQYVEDHTESELMAELGYYRYYDSGKIKWIYNNT